MNEIEKSLLEKKVLIPEVDKDERFLLIPGLLAPNGDVGFENEIFKVPAFMDNAYKYVYTDTTGRVIELTVRVGQKTKTFNGNLAETV